MRTPELRAAIISFVMHVVSASDPSIHPSIGRGHPEATWDFHCGLSSRDGRRCLRTGHKAWRHEDGSWSCNRCLSYWAVRFSGFCDRQSLFCKLVWIVLWVRCCRFCEGPCCCTQEGVVGGWMMTPLHLRSRKMSFFVWSTLQNNKSTPAGASDPPSERVQTGDDNFRI